MQNIRAYLPSARFGVLVGSLILSTVIIAAALAITQPRGIARIESAGDGIQAENADWQAAFASSTAFGDAQRLNDQAAQLIQDASTSNMTGTLGRSLLISLAAARGQGMGDDLATQNSVVASAVKQATGSAAQKPDTYTQTDLSVVSDSNSAWHTYGNAVAQAFRDNPSANYNNVMVPVTSAMNANDASPLSQLPAIATAYRALAKEIISIPVPQTFANTQLQLANNNTRMADAIDNLSKIVADPATGLIGLQVYSSAFNKDEQLVIAAAKIMQNGGILFTADEPGHDWVVLANMQ